MGIFCGVDIIEIERVKKSIESTGNAFRDRVFTQSEIQYCESRGMMKYHSYAARFAVKEAVSKAFGTGISEGVVWKSIETMNDVNGRPYVTLYGKAQQKLTEMKASEVSLSISHCDSYAVAYVTILTDI